MVTRLKEYPISSFKTGLNTAIPAHLIEDTAAQSAVNVQFSFLSAEKTNGYELFVASALTGVPHIIANFNRDDGSEFLVIVTHQKIYKYNTGTLAFDDITGGVLTGASDQPADYDIAFNRFYFTNNNNFPSYWDGTAANIVNVPGLDTAVGSDIEGGFSSVKCKLIKGFSNFLLLGNTQEDGTDYPQRVRWSRFGDPSLWENTVAGAGQAGYVDIPGSDAIVAMKQIKDFMVIYKENSVWIMQYVGPPAIFALRRVVQGIGAICSRAVAVLINQHVFLSTDGVYSFDGVSMTPVSDRISVSFFLGLNNARLEMLNAFFIKEDFQILFPFVDVENDWPEQALLYNYVTQSYGFRDLPATAVGFWKQSADLTWDTGFGDAAWDDITDYWDKKTLSEAGPINLFGDKDGFIYKMNTVDLENTADYEGYFVTKIFDLGNPAIIKRVQRLQILCSREGSYDLQVYAAALENPYEPIVFGTPVTLNLSSGQAFLDMDLSGRYFVFKIRTENGNEHFEISGMNIFFIERGIN